MNVATEKEGRVLVLTRHGNDAATTCTLLARENIVCRPCASLDEVAAEIEAGAGAAIVSIESIGAKRDRLLDVLSSQPPWSDFPFIVLTSGQLSSDASFDWLGKVILLDRPLTVRALITTVRTALRARHRQYEARAAIAQRDQFLAMLGHELRNPLAAIMLASDVGAETIDPVKVAQCLTTIGRQARHLSRLVDDLLDVSRVTSGKIVLQRTHVDAIDVISSGVAALAGFARERGVVVSIPRSRAVIVDADPLRLAQIIDNLLTNAIKYTRRGGTVSVDVTTDERGVAIHVRDDGIGIAPEMLPRIFELFAQVDHTLERANGGMGIGLTLVKRLVEIHGGTVEAASAGVGHGSEFTVHLPVVATPGATASASANSATPDPVPDPTIRAVIIDDNEDVRELGRELLERLGCVVETAGDGREGLDQILRCRPDLALVDIGLPGMNGFDVAEAVRAQLGTAPYLVAVTGYGQAQDRARALAAGFDHHLTKPVRAAAFGEMVAAARKHG